MAEINIERREAPRSFAWIWVVAAVVIIALVWWAVAGRSRPMNATVNQGTPGAVGTAPGGTGGAGQMNGTGGIAGAGTGGGTSGATSTLPGQKVGEPGVGEKVTPGAGTPQGPGGSTEGSH